MPHDWFLLNVCEMFHCTPEVAEGLDALQISRMMDMRLYYEAKSQAETKAADMSSEQVDMFAKVRRWRRETGIDLKGPEA